MERAGSNIRDRTLELRFLESKANEEQPRVALYSIQGGSIRKVRSIEGGKIGLADLVSNVREGASYAFGPDIDEKEVTKSTLVPFRSSKLREWANTGVIEINPRWRDWIIPLACVRGDVHRCRPRWWWLDITTVKPAAQRMGSAAIPESGVRGRLAARLQPGIISPPQIELPSLCAPVCNAVVEVYEKTCCCRLRPPFDDILDRLRDIIDGWPPIPEGPVGPIPEPGPDPAPFRESIKSAMLMRSMGRPIPLGNPPEKLGEDYQALAALPVQDRLAYLDEHYYLYPLLCSCSTRKVGETSVDENGEFSLCFRRRFVQTGCRVTYYYKVRQWHGNQWVYIYDGSTTNEYFKQSDDAHIRTWKGQACDPGDNIPDPGEQFVMLENIGVIPSWKLASPLQDKEFGVNTPSAIHGLVNHNYAGQPWAKTLSFRLKFSEGLKALGAKYYRVSVAKANASGDAIGTPFALMNPVSWRRWKWVGTQLQVETVALGPQPVGGNAGLCLIPYESDAPDGGWLWFQFHQSWNTQVDPESIVDGKYLVIVEAFDATGAKIKPAGTAGTGIEKAFTFRRWSSETTTDAVNFAALAHLFHVNNVPCYGDILDLRKNSMPSTEECQFIQGCGTDNFSVGFYAFHVHKFMASYSLWYHRGLSGPNVTIETGTTNAPASVPPVPSPLNSANAKQSNSKTFADMLDTHVKCSFAVELRVAPKHTNGMGTIEEYRGSDTAAFALEKVPCLDIPPVILRPDLVSRVMERPEVPR